MARPTHFEIPVDDPDRAEKFYATIFGWTFTRYDGAPSYYGLAATGDSTPVSMARCSSGRPGREYP